MMYNISMDNVLLYVYVIRLLCDGYLDYPVHFLDSARRISYAFWYWARRLLVAGCRGGGVDRS